MAVDCWQTQLNECEKRRVHRCIKHRLRKMEAILAEKLDGIASSLHTVVATNSIVACAIFYWPNGRYDMFFMRLLRLGKPELLQALAHGGGLQVVQQLLGLGPRIFKQHHALAQRGMQMGWHLHMAGAGRHLGCHGQ
jgi:hypothetical protein